MSDPKDIPEIEETLGVTETDDLLAEQEQILKEAQEMAAEAETVEAEMQEELKRIQEEHPNLVFEENPNLIGGGVQVSPELMEWALTQGIFSKLRPRRFDRKGHKTKKHIRPELRKQKRKMQKLARRKNRKAA